MNLIRIASTQSRSKANVDAAVCAPCGGRCCKRIPGSVLPSDFGGASTELGEWVRGLLATGRYAIDCYHNPKSTDTLAPAKSYFVRPSVQGDEGLVYDESWGGACTFHSDTGCTLSEQDRPGECKLLIPNVSQKCGFADGWKGRVSVALAWAPYQDFLEELI